MQRNMRLTLLLLLLAVLIPIASLSYAHGLVDQSNIGYGGGTLISVHTPIGQEFTPSQPILTGVDINFRAVYDEGADTITVNIRKGTITAPVLATTSQLVDPCPNTAPYACPLIHFDLPTPLQVTPGDIYVLELLATRNTHAWMSIGGYPAGSAIIQGIVEPAFDYAFQTYYLPSLEVGLDIKPGSTTNPINPQSNGKIAIAILSTSSFDAPTQVDTTSLTFGRTGHEPSLAFCHPHGQDVNGDTLPDLLCHFHTHLAAFQTGDTLGLLNGRTTNGLFITGHDTIQTVP
jgi:hypothetical protein